jgi:hypothetical protein
MIRLFLLCAGITYAGAGCDSLSAGKLLEKRKEDAERDSYRDPISTYRDPTKTWNIDAR